MACARYGVRDVAALIDRLAIIKSHRPGEEES
jgi:hypothetical protein